MKHYAAVIEIWKQCSADYAAAHKTEVIELDPTTTVVELMEHVAKWNLLGIGDVCIGCIELLDDNTGDDMNYTPLQQQYVESVGGNAHQSAVELIGRLEHALEQYACANNWGYYDDSGCRKGIGTSEEACFLGPDIARAALSSNAGSKLRD